jgi:hypothetical protein
MSDSPQERKEECRRRVREYLANRSVLAYRAATVRTGLSREHAFDLDEIKAALLFLVSAKQVSIEHDSLGATPFYQITADGILAHERGA